MNPGIARLRAKTDRELAVLIQRELQRSLTLIEGCQFSEAADARDRAKRWLAVANLAAGERVRLERLLQTADASASLPAAACA